MAKIDKLTPEQEALIPVYVEKWRRIALSTEPIDREKAAKAVKMAYAVTGMGEPDILFFESHHAAEKKWFELHEYMEVTRSLEKLFMRIMIETLYYKIGELIEENLIDEAISKIVNFLFGGNVSNLYMFHDAIEARDWTDLAIYIDFCISVLDLKDFDLRKEWSVVESFLESCGAVYPYPEVALICDRPRILSCDRDNNLHAEGKPALQFADGFTVYAYHGAELPEKYGKVHPDQWQSQWLLEEENAELRRVLIQGIGYSRLCQELQALELDAWREYSLLKIDDADIETIHLLKMTCPSTGCIHALRVPPTIVSAREAIRWVNWDVDPEEFSVET